MSQIIFDIIYKKRVDNESIKLPIDSEFQQLKLMICGKYKIYDLNNLFIYHKGKLIQNNDLTKIKDIFKMKKCKIEIRDTLIKPKEAFKYYCKCHQGAIYICDKCSELLCQFCVKKKIHLNHQNSILPISEYRAFIKKSIKTCASELDEKILNDEDYRFFPFWEYDMNKEINNVNSTIDFLKNELEDIKQMQIDTISSLGEMNKFNDLKAEIEEVIQQYSNINVTNEAEFDQIFEEKNRLLESSRHILTDYNDLKNKLLLYTKVVKDIQIFNQSLSKNISEKFNVVKKRFNQIPVGSNLNVTLNGSLLDNSQLRQSSTTHGKRDISGIKNAASSLNKPPFNQNKLNSSVKDRGFPQSAGKIPLNKANKGASKKIEKEEGQEQEGDISENRNLENEEERNVSDNKKVKSKKNSDKKATKAIDLSEDNLNTEEQNETSKNRASKVNDRILPPQNEQEYETQNDVFVQSKGSTLTHDKYLFKIKDERKIIIFSINTQNFREKNFKDNSNFKKETSSEVDITQLNCEDKLFLLSGSQFNKFYFYDYPSNSINFIATTLASHFYGSLVYCPKNSCIYLIGGNTQTRTEIYQIGTYDTKKENAWKFGPSLNEARQEFAAMCMNDYIYVFFGFSPKKGVNLCSIERFNINSNDDFEVVYVNEQISISSLSCAKFIDEDEEEENQESILLLGGFDGKSYLDSSLILNVREMKIRDCDIVIPNMSKHSQFLFQKESAFIEVQPGVQMIFDMKNNVHRLSNESYELFSVI